MGRGTPGSSDHCPQGTPPLVGGEEEWAHRETPPTRLCYSFPPAHLSPTHLSPTHLSRMCLLSHHGPPPPNAKADTPQPRLHWTTDPPPPPPFGFPPEATRDFVISTATSHSNALVAVGIHQGPPYTSQRPVSSTPALVPVPPSLRASSPAGSLGPTEVCRLESKFRPKGSPAPFAAVLLTQLRRLLPVHAPTLPLVSILCPQPRPWVPGVSRQHSWLG